jgi:hypothetical protein
MLNKLYYEIALIVGNKVNLKNICLELNKIQSGKINGTRGSKFT